MRISLLLIVVCLLMMSCKHEAVPVVTSDLNLVKPIDSIYAYELYKGTLKWNDSSVVHITKILADTSFLTLREGDSIVISPTAANLGSKEIDLQVQNKKGTGTETLKWTLKVLSGATGTGKLNFNWTTGLSGAAATTYINLTKGDLKHSYSFPSCISTGSIAFDGIEIGDWNYEVIRSKLCNAPCNPPYQCPDTSFITHGNLTIFKNQTTPLAK